MYWCHITGTASHDCNGLQLARILLIRNFWFHTKDYPVMKSSNYSFKKNMYVLYRGLCKSFTVYVFSFLCTRELNSLSLGLVFFYPKGTYVMSEKHSMYLN